MRLIKALDLMSRNNLALGLYRAALLQGDPAHLDMAKAKCSHGIEKEAIFIKTGSQANWIGKLHPATVLSNEE